MITHADSASSKRKPKRKAGAGLVNNLINNLPFELHIPGYNYCGPGTRLRERLARGDKGINPLDESCKLHDIAYSRDKTLETRHQADLQLAQAADKRSRESSDFGERLAALAVAKAMKYKVKRGMGIPLNKVIKNCKGVIKKHMKQSVQRDGSKPSSTALLKATVKAAKRFVKNKNVTKKPRVIPLPKKGGFLPLIPLLSALAATGTLAGGVTTAAKNIYDMVKRNQGEKVVGKGLYLRPYKQGMGLYLTPYVKKN